MASPRSKSNAQKPAPSASVAETRLYQSVFPSADAVKVAWLYPAPYSVSMSSLGYLKLFQQMDQSPAVDPIRFASDSSDLADALKAEIAGFSFAFELDILEILRMLQSMGLPLYSQGREGMDGVPLLFAGGPVIMSNPEPYAPFFDFFLIGEGEEMLTTLTDAIAQSRHITNRRERLQYLALHVPGCYVPELYDVTYAPEGGPITAIIPHSKDLPFPVRKHYMTDLDDSVSYTPILTADTVFSSVFLLEVMRGCAHRCRFCLASYTMLPARGPSLSPLLEKLHLGLEHTHKIGLLGALIADHPEFPELCEVLLKEMDKRPELTVSAASLRADTLTPLVAKTFQKGHQRQLTVAIESGSPFLRRRINKHLKEESIFQCAETMAEAGLEGIKLYTMVGLPDETEAHIDETIELVRRLRKAVPTLKPVVGCSTFVPKGATPFQWQPRLDTKTLEKRHQQLKKGLLKTADVRESSAKWDYLQGVFSRGDRRLAPVLERFTQLGASYGSLRRAHKEITEAHPEFNIPSLDWYALRERPEGEILPWDLIHLGVDKGILWKEGLPPSALLTVP